jgi:hypothetical protein
VGRDLHWTRGDERLHEWCGRGGKTRREKGRPHLGEVIAKVTLHTHTAQHSLAHISFSPNTDVTVTYSDQIITKLGTLRLLLGMVREELELVLSRKLEDLGAPLADRGERAQVGGDYRWVVDGLRGEHHLGGLSILLRSRLYERRRQKRRVEERGGSGCKIMTRVMVVKLQEAIELVQPVTYTCHSTLTLIALHSMHSQASGLIRSRWRT